ncbi:MAG: hypothetical protein CR984_07935 [Proteobacteria bacterium]|nr:MAG: hypothetical protein CR984_07935 [Pseudomonadota bacterium]PIE67916.1 MAG: hypothetical protein CSA23_01610 [Deltaproteobacteria bacterium]
MTQENTTDTNGQDEKATPNSSPETLTQNFISHAGRPKNQGTLDHPSGSGRPIGECGDAIAVQVRIYEETITDIKCLPDGCLFTIACASAMSELVKGKPVETALEIQPEDVVNELGGLPEAHMHCARLAVNSLGEAIGDYFKKGAYRKTTGQWSAEGNTGPGIPSAEKAGRRQYQG